MININDYKEADGGIDWKALEAAEIAAGQRCRRCKSGILYPLLTEWTGGKRLCNSCEAMGNDKGDVRHNTDLRCPRCGFLMNVNDYDLWKSGIWGDGEHEINCAECDYEFIVTTNISHSFDSPART